MESRRAKQLRAAAAALLVSALGAAPAAAQSIFDDTQSERVEGAAGREDIKLDLALCAPHLDRLKNSGTSTALADSIEDPECRQAILRAQAAGMTKQQIVDTLMGASDMPDPDPAAPPPPNDDDE